MNHDKPLSNHNRKYGPDVFHFTLPRSTCTEFATGACMKYCYGKSIWHNVRGRYEQNLEDSRDPGFVEAVIKQVHDQRIRWVRIHPVGDFYTTLYFEKWIEIAKACPKTRFLAYTRNWKIDADHAPPNLVLYFSMDRLTEKVNDSLKRFAFAFVPHLQEHQKEYFEHFEKHKRINARVCSNRCENCRACWFGKVDIAFPIITGGKSFKPPGEKYHNPRNLGPRTLVYPSYEEMPPL
jgi:ferredoxin